MRLDVQVGNFEQLYESLRQLLGPAVEPMTRNEGGWSFGVLVKDVRLTVLKSARGSADRALVFVNLGVAHPKHEQELLQQLMEANFILMTQQPTLVCSRDSLTGEAVVQFAYPFNGSDVDHFLAYVDTVTARPAGWVAHLNRRGEAADSMNQAAVGAADSNT